MALVDSDCHLRPHHHVHRMDTFHSSHSGKHVYFDPSDGLYILNCSLLMSDNISHPGVRVCVSSYMYLNIYVYIYVITYVYTCHMYDKRLSPVPHPGVRLPFADKGEAGLVPD